MNVVKLIAVGNRHFEAASYCRHAYRKLIFFLFCGWGGGNNNYLFVFFFNKKKLKEKRKDLSNFNQIKQI